MEHILDELQYLQQNQEAPSWMTPEGLKTIKGGYLIEDKNESPKDAYRRVAKAAASYFKGTELFGFTLDSSTANLEESFFEIMWRGWLGPASPVLANMGNAEGGLPISCFGCHIEDTLDSIYTTLHRVARQTSGSGGTSVYFGDIRPTGQPIRGNKGVSTGVIPWAKIYDSSISANMQGFRRGACAGYLPIEHADAESFIKSRYAEGDPRRHNLDLHLGVTITDDFMNKGLQKDPEAMRLLTLLFKARIERGEPYIFFTDNVNNANPQPYKDRGFKVKHSNLCCLLPTEKVLTKEGAIPIKDLVGKSVEVWDGYGWVKVDNFSERGKTTEFIEVVFINGDTLVTTKNHRFPIKKLDNSIEFIFAEDLKEGQRVVTHDLVEAHIGFIDEVLDVVLEETPVYCCTVETTGMFALADGRMTGNSEITLYDDPEHDFVCCLSSLNLTKYNEWRNTNTVQLARIFLDGVIEEFIQRAGARKGYNQAINFARKSRAVGLGVMGYHTYLQNLYIPFKSEEARRINRSIFQQIKQESDKADALLVQYLGEPEWCKGYGMRATHRLSIAPTVSNSTICGNVSEGVEPIQANYWAKGSLKGVFLQKHPFTKTILQRYGLDTHSVWDSIEARDGSVQHLKELSDLEREVCLTAREIDQMEVIVQAADRQKYIDQSQSINLHYPEAKKIDLKEFSNQVFTAWKLGVKTLYYCRSLQPLKGEKAKYATRDVESNAGEVCQVCQG